jgi:lycopene cyclase domain-containing protein
MSNHLYYFFVLFWVIIFPFIFSFHKKFYFIDKWKLFIKSTWPIALFFILWDVFFTYKNIWWFNPEYTSGIKIFNLPIEEILFFIVIPYACVFTFYNIIKFIPVKKLNTSFTRIFFAVILIISISLATYYHLQWYTFTTFLLLSFTLFYFLFIKDDNTFLKYFLLEYVLTIPGFLFSNGILTGSYVVAQPIVFYNSAHHMGVRIFNIPIEDFFYGMIMLIWISYLFYIRYKTKFTEINS